MINCKAGISWRGEMIMRYEIFYGQLLTRIDQFHADGRWAATVYVHRAEYRTWEA